MAIELKMPALSPTMEEGTLAKWLVKEGDSVQSGDLLAEIETDKATMEFEAVDEGVVGKILVAAGTEGVKVGTVIALIEGEGDETPAKPAAPQPPAAMPEPVAAPATPPAAAPVPSAALQPRGPAAAASPMKRTVTRRSLMALASRKPSQRDSTTAEPLAQLSSL